ncbi:DsbA family protein [Antarctobacter jejuensis]|uniref:DsbA family protein n=1 Tax=Antarctobacter jejuensis TaxID=1439938 RepID=UPI003FD25328
MDSEASQHSGQTRRGLLKLGFLAALVAGSAGVSALLRRRSGGDLDRFEPVPGVPGFRRPVSGQALSGNPMLLGLDGDGDGGVRRMPLDLCRALFPADRRADQIPVAYFTDARCVVCRGMEPLMTGLHARPEIAMRWHELPLLGPVSVQAARAALAAGLQEAYLTFHERLMGSPVLATPDYLRELAAEAGIDAGQLLEDMQSPAVDRQLRETAELARRFGFVGTPGLVIGSVAVLGRVDRNGIERLIDLARSDPGSC